MIEVKNLVDVRTLLKQFGLVVYTGDAEADKALMVDELKELQEMGLIAKETFIAAYRILK
ncbi:DUF910 family protein [Hazenella sp. IB182357]|uniref:DUF910 family protein n=1 Tax=Polycladospora coralii TaxID=2771432 RepID=A0A926NCA0_9BACL|nr:YqgQ family protein [Polycladospora coralii]MBD1373617.1 DUF910 family protein [Polycladospora coralii]MBS7529659.1 DUF910 family protein [Polycladospora coralii]